MAELSDSALAVLEAYIRYADTEGRSPAFDEVASRIERTAPTVQYHARQLAALGYLEKLPKRKGYRPVRTPDGLPYERQRVRFVPAADVDVAKLLEESTVKGVYYVDDDETISSIAPPKNLGLVIEGVIAAGPLSEAISTRDRVVPLTWFEATDSEHFFMRVTGDSMADAIQDGDVILCRRADTAENGQIVVALVDGESTLKRFRKRGATVRLEPLNPAFEPIVLRGQRAASLQIQGRAVGILRSI